MRAFPAEAALALLLVALPVGARAAEPLRLVPSAQTDAPATTALPPAAGGPIRLGPAPADPSSTFGLNSGAAGSNAPAVGRDAKSPPRGIAVRALGAPEPDDAGISIAAPLPDDLWVGSSRKDVIRLMSALARPTSSPAARALTLRLVASGGQAPEATDGDAPTRRFGAVRVEVAASIGAAREARALADAMPGVLDDEGAARALARAELNRGTLDCAKSADTIRKFDGDWWRRLDVLCRAIRKERDSAQLGLDMMRERGAVDGAFETAIDKLVDLPPPESATLGTADAVTLAAFAAAGFSIPASAVPRIDPVDMEAVARNTPTDSDVRVAAAETAASLLLLDARELASIQATIQPRDADLVRLDDLATRLPGPRARALTINALASAIDGRRRADIIAAAMRLTSPAMRVGPQGVVVAASLDSFNPSRQTLSLAPAALRITAATGRVDKARRWYALMSDNDQTRGEAMRLWPLAVLSDAAPESGDITVDDWVENETRAKRTRPLALLPALAALGIAVPETTPDAGIANALVSDVEMIGRLGADAAESRVGETILTALVLMNGKGPAGVSPGTLTRIVEALTTIRMEAEARGLVREAAAVLIE